MNCAIRRLGTVLTLFVVGAAITAALPNVASVAAQEGESGRVGDLEIALSRAELRPALEGAEITPQGEFLLVWLTLTNTGVDAIDYDVCPPGAAICVNQGWFAAVDGEGRPYAVDLVATGVLDFAEEEVLHFGGVLPPGDSADIVLVFDVPATAGPWSLTSTDEAPAPFAIPLAATVPAPTATGPVIRGGMNEVVALGDLQLAATRAEVRSTIDLASFPEPFSPAGEFLVVRLTLTNAGSGPMEYDICPPDGRVCVNQTWFQAVDAQGGAFPVEAAAWAAFSQTEGLLPFGASLNPGFPEPIVLVFDVPPGITEWLLTSTDQAAMPFSIRLTLSPAPGSIRVVSGGSGGEGGAAPGGAVELILDTSGSMLQELEGQPRIEVAKTVLTDLVTQTVPAGTPLALRVFGDTPGSCETRLAAPLAPLDPGAMAAQIGQLEAIDEVKTPIGAALERVADDLRGVEGTKIVVLVTDGEETCGGDVTGAIRSLVDQGIDIRVNVVGFAVADETVKAQFREWAHAGNGRYFDATGAEELGAAIAQAVQPPFRVLDSDGTEIATGVVDGTAVEVPAGRYRVEVQTAPARMFEEIVVGSSQRVELSL